jgi:DNA-binding NarL/FixJ family response regulator
MQEEKILQKILEKKTNLEIAIELNLTKRTIERYITRLLYKTNLNVRTELGKLSNTKLKGGE